MIVQDDRPQEQKGWLMVVMTDRCLSGWGKAKGDPSYAASYAAWPFPDGELSHVESWVRSRTDAMRVRVVLPSYRPPNYPGHCHIYKYSGQGK